MAAGVQTDIPARLDRLPWSAWHWRMAIALGTAWVLDGLEVTLVGSFGSILERPETLGLTAVQVGWAGSLYVMGAVTGALFFGRMADTIGRKRLFLATLAIYMTATLLTGISTSAWFFIVCRFVTGLGIGGEYAAINSAIDELVPARVRGRVSLAINGSFWIGAAAGAGLSLILLDEALVPVEWGWRLGFIMGAAFALAIVLVRRHVPESPRWLLIHGRVAEAERIVADIEAACLSADAAGQPVIPASKQTVIGARDAPRLMEILRVLFHTYRRRAVVALALMASQAFFYNAIFFTYALVLTRFYGIADSRVGLYIFPFALGNVLGPVLLGPLFDLVGRRRMIAATYILAGAGLGMTAWAFQQAALDATGQALCWSAVFFLASAAASSAYLTVSEVFPLEMRALAISVFFAIGMGIGGAVGPALFGILIESGQRLALAGGYAFSAALMILAGFIALRLGVDAERRGLEEIARPLTADAAAAHYKLRGDASSNMLDSQDDKC